MVILLGLGGILVLGGLFFYGILQGLLPGGHFASSERGARLHEVVKQEGNSHERILMIRVEGVIAGDPIDGLGYNIVELLQQQLDRAADDVTIKAVILKVDSPGGEVLASDEMYLALADFQEHSKKPVIASMGGMAASGGYYISAPCQWIVANDLTITGSIGVIMHGINYRGLMDKLGIRPEVFKSGKFKDMLSGDKREEDIAPEERQMVQKMVNDTFARFKEVVAKGRESANKRNGSQTDVEDRGRTLIPNWAEYADGRILSGKDAFQLGFVDELGNFDTAVERAKQIVEMENPEVIELHPTFDLSNLLHLLGDSKARSIKVDLGVERSRLKAGYMYFIWPIAIP